MRPFGVLVPAKKSIARHIYGTAYCLCQHGLYDLAFLQPPFDNDGHFQQRRLYARRNREARALRSVPERKSNTRHTLPFALASRAKRLGVSVLTNRVLVLALLWQIDGLLTELGEASRSVFRGAGMADWRDELSQWLAPFLARFGHKARRRMCPLYVAGLIGPGDRKSVGPMAERVAPGDYDQLHHFVSDGVWNAGPLELELALQADRLVAPVQSRGSATFLRGGNRLARPTDLDIPLSWTARRIAPTAIGLSLPLKT